MVRKAKKIISDHDYLISKRYGVRMSSIQNGYERLKELILKVKKFQKFQDKI